MATQVEMDMNFTVLLTVGNKTMSIPLGLMKEFKTISYMIEDIGWDYKTPIIVPPPQGLEYSHNELTHFIELMKLAINPEYTPQAFYDLATQMEITSNEVKKFLLLVNFLDNETYLNALARYTAQLIREGKFDI
jgi:hypothetical protein